MVVFGEVLFFKLQGRREKGRLKQQQAIDIQKYRHSKLQKFKRTLTQIFFNVVPYREETSF